MTLENVEKILITSYYNNGSIRNTLDGSKSLAGHATKGNGWDVVIAADPIKKIDKFAESINFHFVIQELEYWATFSNCFCITYDKGEVKFYCEAYSWELV